MPIRKSLKRILPEPAVNALKAAEMYGTRMSTLCRIGLDVKGLSSQDKRVLLRSFASAPVLMLKDLDTWRDPYLLEDAELVAKGLGSFAVRKQSDDLVHVALTHNKALCAKVRELVRPGDTVIDAGANVGGITVLMAKCTGATGKVVSVEMMPDTADILRRNVALNGLDWVEVVECALSNVSGERLTAEVRTGFFGQARLSEAPKSGTQTVEVVTKTIDALTAGLQDIQLMKMDLEGAEMNALAGATDTLKRIPNILFESWEGAEGPVARFFLSEGFEVTAVDNLNFLASRR